MYEASVVMGTFVHALVLWLSSPRGIAARSFWKSLKASWRDSGPHGIAVIWEPHICLSIFSQSRRCACDRRWLVIAKFSLCLLTNRTLVDVGSSMHSLSGSGSRVSMASGAMTTALCATVLRKL